MLVAGVTGGIGAGKSTFAALLAERGANVIDADALGHEALRPGTATWHSVVDQFGDDILSAGSMQIDRKALGRIVFDDRNKLAALNAIVHPYIVKRIADELERLRSTDAIVILDAALIVELGLEDALDVLIVVATDPNARAERVSTARAMPVAEVTARIRAQAPDPKLLEKADVVIHNDGTLEDLARRADDLWRHLQEMQDARA